MEVTIILFGATLSSPQAVRMRPEYKSISVERASYRPTDVLVPGQVSWSLVTFEREESRVCGSDATELRVVSLIGQVLRENSSQIGRGM
jgi:hypothetical protein